MPFAVIRTPSLALTQLTSVLNQRYGKQIYAEIFYINHDFAHYIGNKLYQYIADSGETIISGLGDWFFRQSAFPELPDNTADYFRRYYPYQDKQTHKFRQVIQEKRERVEIFLDELITKYDLHQAELIGFTSMFFQNVASFAMARKLKERNPNIITVMGGANCEVPMGQEIVKHVEQIDYVFSGPGLKSFPAFIQNCLEQKIERCDAINGVFSRSNCTLMPPQKMTGELPTSGKLYHVGIVGEELDINAKIELDYESFLDIFEKNFPNNKISPALLFETSRGCHWGQRSHCTFCGLNGSTIHYRAMNPENAIEQFKSLFRFSYRCSRFNCVDNIMPKNYLKEVFPFLCIHSDITIFYDMRADLSEKDIKILSKAGVRVIQPGIEALSTSTLKLMKKGTSAFQNLRFLMNCLMYDVYAEWNLLVGFPGENKNVYEKYIHDIPLLTHLIPPFGVSTVRFVRYSPYFDQAKEYGLDLRPYDFYELLYPFDKKALKNIAAWFWDHNTDAEYVTVMNKWISKIEEKANWWWNRWYGKDGKPLPKLFLKQKRKFTVVYDSRSGEIIEHPINNIQKKILESLTKPKSLTNLHLNLSYIPNIDPDEELAFLQERGLIFKEGELFMSLVLSIEPPQRSSDKVRAS